MEKEVILEKIKKLSSAIAEKNQRLVDSKNNMVNFSMYEFTLFWCQFGELLSSLRTYYDSVGWPTSYLDYTTNYRSLIRIDDETRECHNNLAMLEKINCLNMEEFYSDDYARDFLDEVILRASNGEYIVPEDENLANTKREIICKTADIFYRLLQGKKEKQDHNVEEFSKLSEVMKNYQVYKDKIGVEISYLSPNEYKDLETVYEGPQFGKELEECFSVLGKAITFEDGPSYNAPKSKIKRI